MENKIKIDYPQKLNLVVEFPYALFDIHNSFDYLEDKWEAITDLIKEKFKNKQLSILKTNKKIAYKEFSTIEFQIQCLANPPEFDCNFIVDFLLQHDENLLFTIKTNDEYVKNEWKILYKTKIK
ncbi:hypothetical protein [Empedobacter sedimenti]|uniref:hypothetical protein n=1 Tax=Empedobacter sedimenti TaxID=3042610 RepID=UPI0024A6F519|nr:hypothetical protein [Empedobacter sedimenti]